MTGHTKCRNEPLYDGLPAEERIAELEEAVRCMESDNARLTDQVKAVEPMRFEYERGGFAEVIKGLNDQIRTLNARVEFESHEKGKNFRAADFWRREAIKRGWSRDLIIDIETGEEVTS